MEQPAIYGALKHVDVDLAGPFLTNHHDNEGRVLASLLIHHGVFLMTAYFTECMEFTAIPGPLSAFIAEAF